jgi:hypothetical protein
VVERVRELTAIALTKGDNSLALQRQDLSGASWPMTNSSRFAYKLFQQSRTSLPPDDRLTRGRIVARLANVPPCLIGIETGMATHYVARKLNTRS